MQTKTKFCCNSFHHLGHQKSGKRLDTQKPSLDLKKSNLNQFEHKIVPYLHKISVTPHNPPKHIIKRIDFLFI